MHLPGRTTHAYGGDDEAGICTGAADPGPDHHGREILVEIMATTVETAFSSRKR